MKYVKEIRFRPTPEEKSPLKHLAQEKGISQSAVMRQLLYSEGKKRGLLKLYPAQHLRL